MAESYFIDSDVILDYLMEREPFFKNAQKIFQLAETGVFDFHFSSLSASNIYYFSRKIQGHEKAVESIDILLSIFKILPVGEIEIKNAISRGFSDFEDGIQFETAIQNSSTRGIITRNISDYKKSTLPIFTPENFLNLFK